MASKRAAGPDTRTKHWAQRLSSADFKKSLTVALAAELRHLGTLEVSAVVDRKLGHALIDDWDMKNVDQEQLSEVILAASNAVNEVLRESKRSPHELLGAHTVKRMESILFDDGALSSGVEDLVSELMQQEFTRQLFTEIIFTSIVSFNKKVNPLFGSFAMRAMEDQIKGFIRLFMPMIQNQAAAFAVDNQTAVLDLTRKLVHEGLRRPLGSYLREPSPRHKSARTALLRHVLDSAELETLSRATAHAVWDSIHASVGNRKIGELVHLDKHAEHMAARGTELILPLLQHAPILELIVSETAPAVDAAPAAAKPRRARPAARKA